MRLKISPQIHEAGSHFACRLAGQFEGIGVEPMLPDCQANIDRDTVLLDRLLNDDASSPVIRIWQNSNCLVAPRSMTRNARFGMAAEKCPLPVVHRQSGGTAVIHGPHIVNVSIAAPVTEHSMRAYYAPITDILIPALRAIGLSASIGSVKGAHCDGRFNICIGNRKLAGTAAFVRSRGNRMATVAHANLAVSHNQADLSIIETFERDLGLANHYRNSAHTSVHAESHNDGSR